MADLKSVEAQVNSDLAADLAALRNDISKLSASVLDLVEQQATTTKSHVFEAVEGARQKFADQSAEARDRVGALTSDLESTIERNPFAAIFAGALAGFLIGILVRPGK
jgi:ElaB/YqjD/DUF883 family membrane-anchored ribosome-binding protein